jgi:hypothetical protein
MLFSSLETFLTTLREEKEFKNFEIKATNMCVSNVYKKYLKRKKETETNV